MQDQRGPSERWLIAALILTTIGLGAAVIAQLVAAFT